MQNGFITAFTTAREMSPSSVTYSQSTFTPFYSYKIHVTITSHLRQSVPCGFFPSSFSTRTLWLLFYSILPTCPADLMPLDLTPPKKNLVSVKYHADPKHEISPNFLPLKPKSSPQHPDLQHPQPMPLPSCTYSKYSIERDRGCT
jgi:hypothetical protein